MRCDEISTKYTSHINTVVIISNLTKSKAVTKLKVVLIVFTNSSMLILDGTHIEMLENIEWLYDRFTFQIKNTLVNCNNATKNVSHTQIRYVLKPFSK